MYSTMSEALHAANPVTLIVPLSYSVGIQILRASRVNRGQAWIGQPVDMV